LAVTIVLSVAATAEPVRFAQDRFVVGFWVDPPFDGHAEERIREIAEAGFTMYLGGFSGGAPEQTTQLLDLCGKYGLKVILHAGMDEAAPLPEHPACWGYALLDEPSADLFPTLQKRVDDVRTRRPGRFAYINLLPTYATADQLGTADYDTYVRRFMDEVDPDVLSMDHYPLMRPDVDARDGYCANLEIMRKHAIRKNVPCWNFFNIMPYGPQYDPTEAQVRWQIFASIAYGAKGVLYFCYFTPLSPEFPKGGAIIARDGHRTRHYDQAQRINAVLRSYGPTLMQLTSTGIFRAKRGEDLNAKLAGSPIASISEGAWTAGVFQHKDGRRALLLLNDDYSYTSWPTVQFDAPTDKVSEVNPKTGAIEPLRDDSPDMDGLQLSFDSGEARLFVLPAKE
jgi:hypothetical protein